MKYSIHILLFVILVMVLAACKQDPKDNENQQKKITFWHFWSEPYQQSVIDTLIAAFEKEYDCEVEVTLLSWNDGKMKLTAAFNSNTAPDVLELGSDWTAQFASAGVLQELTAPNFDFSKYLDFALEPTQWQGKHYTLPWTVATRALFCNMDLIKQVMPNAEAKDLCPTSNDDLLKLATLINQLPEAKGIGINSSDAHRLYKKILPMFWTYGGGIFDDEMKLIVDCPQNIAALEMYCSLAREGFIETQRQIDASFIKGKTGFCVSGSWLQEKIETENPNLNYKICLVPGQDTKKGISFAGGEYLAINKKTNNNSIAETFIKYMTDGRNAVKFCYAIPAAGFPAEKDYYAAPELLQKENNKIFALQLQFAKMTPMHPKWLDIEAIIEEATVEALYGKKTPTEALYDAKVKISQIII